MTEREHVVGNANGLHTRPGSLFVEEAKRYESEVRVEKGERSANAKSLLKLLRIGISWGDRIRIVAEGRDEAAAVEGLCAFLAALERDEGAAR